MCNIWRIPGDEPELTTDDWLKLLSDDFFSDVRELDITGGEPFLLDDIDYLFSGISMLKRANLKKLQSVAVTTNGFLTDRVLSKTEIILKQFKKTGIDLVVVCAVDATGDIHEKIRNVKDAWQKVNKTINGLLQLRHMYPNLIAGVKTTILPINIDELENISQYADERDLFTIMSPRIITGGRYLNLKKEKDLAFSKEDIEKMIRFFKGSRFKWSFHADTLSEYLETGCIKKPCSCGYNYFFTRSSGEVFLCPLINKGIGNVKNESIISLFSSKKARSFRKKIGEFPECRICTEPGLERYALPYEGFTYLGTFLKYEASEFLELHKHLGLDKYI
jgi:MoaA/NifB/PqqE/SkfB family radical SAM enzyme